MKNILLIVWEAIVLTVKYTPRYLRTEYQTFDVFFNCLNWLSGDNKLMFNQKIMCDIK